MPSSTSFDELYTAFGTVIESSTGRSWWRKGGIQAQPVQPYATLYLTQASGFQHQVVEDVEMDPVGTEGQVFEQRPWGACAVDCEAEFFRSSPNNSALDAATRFSNSLLLEERFRDIWEISGLLGAIRIIDISGIFRADTEPRAQVRFTIQANISSPLPLTDTQIYDIQHQVVDVTHVKIDEEETVVSVDVDQP